MGTFTSLRNSNLGSPDASCHFAVMSDAWRLGTAWLKDRTVGDQMIQTATHAVRRMKLCLDWMQLLEGHGRLLCLEEVSMLKLDIQEQHEMVLIFGC